MESVVIPDGVTTLGDKAFGNNLKLASVTLPKELVTIGQMAFSWCEILPEITIPEKVKTLASGAFTGCYKLNTIHCLPTTPPALANWSSLPQNGGATQIYVPENSVDAYKAAWPDFAGLIESATRIRQIRYTSTDGNIVTPREGSVFGANIVSNTYENGVGIIEFDGPVTTIDYQGSYISAFDAAFSDCLTLESIEIPNTVTSIGHQSFFGCKNMKSVSLPKNITELKSYTFHNCI